VAYLSLSPEDRENMDSVATAIKWPRYVATGVYVLHTMLTELLWGWTIGKKLFGLRVTLLDGAPPPRGALFWRNLLRVVDVAMIFPALLVFITPLRQRVGDVATETIVVLRGAAQASPPEPATEQDKAPARLEDDDDSKGAGESGGK
jgi:uncharacterized RDD family membrane protein YckC